MADILFNLLDRKISPKFNILPQMIVQTVPVAVQFADHILGNRPVHLFSP